MFYESNLDVSAPFDAPTLTPMKNSSMTVFTEEELRGRFSFTPSAWKTPQPARTAEIPYKGVAPITPSYFAGTPGAYREDLGTPSPSLKHRGVPEAHWSPIASIGVSPVRIMGPHIGRDLVFEMTPVSSPFSLLGQRKIYTPKRLRTKHAQEELERSLFGMASTPASFPTALMGRVSPPHATPPPPEPSSPSLSSDSRGDLEAAARAEANSEEDDEENSTGEYKSNEGESGDNDNEESNEHEGEYDGPESEAEGAVHHTATSTNNIHSQQNAQNGGVATDGNVWPFPTDRDDLLGYLEQGLSLRHLFPSSREGVKFRCNAELELVGERCETWGRTAMCTQTAKTLESYQRHVKQHLGGKREGSVALDHIVKNVWRCTGAIIPRQSKSWIRVTPWDPNTLDVPFIE